jgi:tetratricopeptide (TPR) repeat protein
MEIVSKIARTTIYIVSLVWLFLFPLFFLPTTVNYFEPNKLLLTIIVLAIDLFCWGLIIIGEKRLKITFTPLTLPTLLLGAVFVLSSFLGSKNTAEALMGRGTYFAVLALIVFITTATVDTKKFIRLSLYALIGSAAVLSLVSIAQAIGFGPSTLINKILGTAIPNTLAFTPAGSPLGVLSFLAAILIITIFLAFSFKQTIEKVIFFLLSAVLTAGFVLLVIYSFPGKDTAPVILPPEYGYSIAMETLKNTKTALFGYGPESFVVAYNRARPATINLSPFWNIRFTSSSNELFQAVTTGGILALIVWAYLTISIFKLAKVGSRQPLVRIIKLVTIGLLFLFILIPATFLHLFLFFVMLTLWSLLLKFEHTEKIRNLDIPLTGISLVRPDSAAVERKESPIIILPFLISLPLMLAAVALSFYTSQIYAAEMTFKQAVDAAARNEGVPTYDLQRTAIVKDPYMPRYRRAYSATNLALANAIAGKQDLTDQDRQNITQLIQQSIREAKAAVTLEPDNAQNWENLAVVYRALIGIAQNADSWTVASLAQAIQNDPLNPRLRLELGGVFYTLGQYDQAIRLYQQSSELKPDWANAYYNLANAYKQKKEYATAFDYLRKTLTLVKADSADYVKAQAELEELSKLLNLKPDQSQVAPAQTELQVPRPNPTSSPENQVNLPQNAGPENFEPNLTIPQEAPPPTPTIQLNP